MSPAATAECWVKRAQALDLRGCFQVDVAFDHSGFFRRFAVTTGLCSQPRFQTICKSCGIACRELDKED